MKWLWLSKLMQRFWQYAGAVSIRIKVLGIVIGVILLLGAFVIFQIRGVLTNTLSYELEEQGITLASNIAQDAGTVLIRQDITTLNSLLLERKIHYSSESHNTIVDYIVVEDADGEIIASQGNFNFDEKNPIVDRSHSVNHRVFLVNNARTVEIYSNLPQINGQLRLGLSTVSLTQTVNEVTFQLFATTLVMVAIGFGAAFFLTWILTRPILDLVSTTHAVAQGDFTRRVTRWSDDEIGELSTAFNHMIESLAHAEQERMGRDRLREHYISGVILAQENERQRIARELHDSTSQSLTSLLVGLQYLKQSDDITEIYTQVDELRKVIAITLDEIREISWRLRPRALDDLGLASAIENYIQDYQNRYGIMIEIVIRGMDQRLAPEIETTVYRIIQEGLTNITRYAQATQVSLIVTCKENKLKIIIEDNGIGFDPEAVLYKKSLGLQGIRERAGLFGGTLTIESQSGQGASLFIEMLCSTPEKEQYHDA